MPLDAARCQKRGRVWWSRWCPVRCQSINGSQLAIVATSSTTGGTSGFGSGFGYGYDSSDCSTSGNFRAFHSRAHAPVSISQVALISFERPRVLRYLPALVLFFLTNLQKPIPFGLLYPSKTQKKKDDYKKHVRFVRLSLGDWIGCYALALLFAPHNLQIKKLLFAFNTNANTRRIRD